MGRHCLIGRPSGGAGGGPPYDPDDDTGTDTRANACRGLLPLDTRGTGGERRDTRQRPPRHRPDHPNRSPRHLAT
ncbi:MAG TPA: hypothetical protein VFV33_20020 [Gemmatimonadaceae bacterium]|nr:hypothetical protein [Gemmatimonadaceae bacterium]